MHAPDVSGFAHVERKYAMTVLSNIKQVSLLIASALMATAGASSAMAADMAAQKVQIRGVIQSVSGDELHIQSREGAALNVGLKPDAIVSAVAQAKISDIKKGDYVGIASLPKTGGGDGALEVLIFPAQLKGANEGNFSWDLKPGSSMTNATVANSVTSVSNSEVTVTYHGHQKKIAIPAGTPVVTLAAATRDDIKPGTTVFVPAEKSADGKFTANTVIVGKNGVVPPM